MEKYSDVKKVNDFRFGEATILKEKVIIYYSIDFKSACFTKRNYKYFKVIA
jgi:hypothetical protein